MKELLYKLSMFTILFSIGIILLITYWMIYPYTPITFNNLPHVVDKKVVQSGDYLTYVVDFCKNNTLIPSVNKTFVDGLIYNTAEVTGTIKETGCHKTNVFMYVPKALPPGTYSIKISYRYQVNPIRTVTIESETERFEVIK